MCVFKYTTSFVVAFLVNLLICGQVLGGDPASVIIASVDSRTILSTFTSKLEMGKYIMSDYQRYIAYIVDKPLKPEEKEKKIKKELDHIIAHYASQIMTPMSDEINKIVKAKSISVLLNKSSFSFKSAILEGINYRPNMGMESENEYLKQCDNLFSNNVFISSLVVVDITDDVFKASEKRLSGIKLLPYRFFSTD